jgi:hypothetical protein
LFCSIFHLLVRADTPAEKIILKIAQIQEEKQANEDKSKVQNKTQAHNYNSIHSFLSLFLV